MRISINHYLFILLSAAIVFTAGCNGNSESKYDYEKDQYFKDTIPSKLSKFSDSVFIKADSICSILENELKKIRLDETDSQYYYVVEGDLLMDYDELYAYCLNTIASGMFDSSYHNKKIEENLFTVSTINGEAEKWPEDFVIRYAILRNSFARQEDYDSTVQCMKKATEDWMSICNIHFEYLSNYDQSVITDRPLEPLTFIVRQLNTGGAFLAQAFFPADSPKRRKVCIDPTFFNSNNIVSKVGILRHELGHVLGARHEHIWSKENECKGENIFDGIRGAKQFTNYDPYSVMHYLCNKGNPGTLELTPFDISGAQKLYGPVRK